MLQLADEISKFLIWILMAFFLVGLFMKREPGWYYYGKLGLLVVLGALSAILAREKMCSWWIVVLIFCGVIFGIVWRWPVVKRKEEKNAA